MTVVREAKKETYFPELDGLRTLAFLLVFMYHCAPGQRACAWLNKYCAWGWSGVDLFFVLSGFLITYLLLKEKREVGSISIKKFYMRRILRIWPLYFLVMSMAALAPLLQPDYAKMDVYWRYLREIIAPFCCFAGNYAIMLDFGALVRLCLDWHLPTGRMATLILPLWSLCIEEQFYIVWPIALLVMNRSRTMWITVASLIATSVCSLYLLRHFGWYSGHGYVYFYLNTPARMGSLMIGAAVALAESHHPGWATKLFSGWRGGLALTVLAAISVAICNWGVPVFECRSSAFWIMCLISCGYGLLLLTTLYWPPLRAWLSNPVLARFGRYTYAMYLFHFLLCDVTGGWVPHAIFTTATTAWMAHLTLAFLATFAAAQLSWSLLESRMLALRKHFRSEAPAAPAREPSRELVSV